MQERHSHRQFIRKILLICLRVKCILGTVKVGPEKRKKSGERERRFDGSATFGKKEREKGEVISTEARAVRSKD